MKTAIMPLHTSPNKVLPLPPSYIFDDNEDDSQEENAFGLAHSPSKLHMKYRQDDEDEDEYDAEYYTLTIRSGCIRPVEYMEEYQHYPRGEMMQVPVTLIAELRHMLTDYQKRFPDPPRSEPVQPPLEVT